MKPSSAASLVALAILFATGRASAQSAPAAAPESPPVMAGGGAVRLHLRAYRYKDVARLYILRQDQTHAFVCASPCVADVAIGSELRVTLGDDADEPHAFTVPPDVGSEVDVEVRPASIGPLVGGLVMMGSGGAFILSGALLVALSDVTTTTKNGRSSSGNLETPGYIVIGLGAAVAVGGLVWMLTRSHEPRIQSAPYRGQVPQFYGRAETTLGDLGDLSQRTDRLRRDLGTATSPIVPLHLTFHF